MRGRRREKPQPTEAQRTILETLAAGASIRLVSTQPATVADLVLTDGGIKQVIGQVGMLMLRSLNNGGWVEPTDRQPDYWTYGITAVGIEAIRDNRCVVCKEDRTLFQEGMCLECYGGEVARLRARVAALEGDDER